MAIEGFLETRQVFTSAEFARAFPDSQTDRNLLSRAVRNRRVERVRRGVYVSKAGPFRRTSADPFLIAVALAEDAVFAYASALQLHGALHNLTKSEPFPLRLEVVDRFAGRHKDVADFAPELLFAAYPNTPAAAHADRR